MGTINKAFADRMIKANGQEGKDAPDNPPIIKIVEYKNAWGIFGYGAVFSTDRDKGRYERESEYIKNPRIYWQREQDDG